MIDVVVKTFGQWQFPKVSFLAPILGVLGRQVVNRLKKAPNHTEVGTKAQWNDFKAHFSNSITWESAPQTNWVAFNCSDVYLTVFFFETLWCYFVQL